MEQDEPRKRRSGSAPPDPGGGDLALLGRRYKRVRFLGQGGQGSVHLVEDRHFGGRQLALKTLRPHAEETWRSAFRHEFEALAGLLHPRLAEVHDFGTTLDGLVFFTRDYVAGEDLRAATAHIDTLEILRLFVEVCRALEPLHRRGLVHGDLKPGNVICSSDGVARLIDFSFVRSSGEDAMRRGTVPYMAPEVIEGMPADARADLYSLGAAFFEMCSGAPPFEGRVEDIVAGHLGAKRPKPGFERVGARDADEEVRRGLGAIVARLIARRPDDRFPDISEVEAALTALAPDLIAPDPLPDFPLVSESAGRGREIARIRAGIEERLRGSSDAPPLRVIEGELGTGKSAVLRGLKWWAELSGIPVLEARLGGSGLLFVAASLVDQALGFLAEGGLAQAAKHLLASLTRLGGAGLRSENLTQEATRLLTKCAGGSGLLIAFDDVDQATPEVLSFVRGLSAAIGPSDRIVILAAVEASFPWRDRLGLGEGVRLPVLGSAEIEPLVASFLGRAAPHVVERILTHTGGNPLFVMTLLRDLAASGEGAERLERLGPPRRLEVYWRDRLATLRTALRDLLEAAAVLGRPADARELGAVVGGDAAALLGALNELEGHGWLRRGAGGWQVTTRPLAEEVLTAAEPRSLRDKHRRAMAVEPDEALLLLHAAKCRDVDTVLGRGRDVARSLEHLGALHAARDLLTAMADVLEGREEAAAVALDLGRVCLAEGDYETARNHLEPLAAGKDAELGRQALLLLGRLRSRLGELDAAADHLERALRVRGKPRDEAEALLELANVDFKRGDLAACERAADSGMALAPSGDPVRADLLTVLAKAAARDGRHGAALERARQAVEEARLTGNRRSLALAIGTLSWVRQRSGDLRGAVEELERAVALNREFGDYPRLMRDERVLGDLKWWLEEWREALAHYEEAVRLAAAVASPVQRLEVQIGLGQALAKVGRFERAQLLLGSIAQEAARLGQEELALEARCHLADLTASSGRVDEAIERCYGPVRADLERLGRQAYLADLELELAGWHLWRAASGDTARAGALVESAKQRKREVEGRGFAERLLLHSGALAVAEGRYEQGMAALDELVARKDEVGLGDLAWQAHLAAARANAARGADFLARRRLRMAEDILDRLTAGFSTEQRTAFWQDVRRAEVRRLLQALAPSSITSSSLLAAGQEAAAPDQEAEVLYRVLELNKRLLAEHDIDRLLGAILDAAIEITGAERGLVLLTAAGSAGDRLDVRASRDIGADEAADAHARFSRSIAESVHLDGEPVVTIDAMGDSRFSEFLSIHELKLRSVACVPVRCRGAGLGVLYLENRLRRGRFGGKDLRVLTAFADQVAMAIFQARLLEQTRVREAELDEARRTLAQALERKSADLEARSADLKLTRERLERVRRQLEGFGDFHGVIGGGAAMQRVFGLVDRVKDLDVPVVFVGASGTGKDVLARLLHDSGARHNGPFVALSCGGVPETLVEATLFGHVKGAFSGAAQDRRGVLQEAHGGTLYLDEIGDMSPRMQVDLLRVLQEGSFAPLGATQPIRVDLRLVASSKVPLDELVAKGRLRRDLLYRVEVVTIEIPPLAERREDILPLARRILDREAAHSGASARPLGREAAAALLAHGWPGNVRELEQVLRRVVAIGEGQGPIAAEEIFDRPSAAPAEARERRRGGRAPDDDEALILATLERCQWNRTRAAEELGIPRRTFYRKLSRMGLLKPE